MTNSRHIEFLVVDQRDLTSTQRESMFNLLRAHFNGLSREQFFNDLEEKNLALLLEQEGSLAGFSTLMGYTTCFQGKPINVIYSGDTIVDPAAWGSSALPRAWVRGVHQLQSNLPPVPCYWLLICSGFRTYRFLSVFWREFFPRYDRATPPEVRELIHDLARERFGRQFDASAGIVRFRNPQRLTGGLETVDSGRRQNPHTEFFLTHNPHYAQGDELVCLADLSPDNLTGAGRRMMLPHEMAGDRC